MSGERIINALGTIDNKYIEEATPGKKRTERRFSRKWVTAAACVLLAVFVIGLVLWGNRRTSEKIHTTKLESGETISFAKVNAFEQGSFVAAVYLQELSEEEVSMLFGTLPVSAEAVYGEKSNELLGFTGSIGDCIFHVETAGVSLDDTVIEGHEQISVINGVSVSAGYYLTDANGSGEKNIIYYAYFTLDHVRYYVEQAGPQEDSASVRQSVAEKILALIKNGTISLAPGEAEDKGLGEDELLAIMEEKAGNKMKAHLYVDMDHDGAAELIGTYSTGRVYYTWYCSSDGKICEIVTKCETFAYTAELMAFEFGNETHVKINMIDDMVEYSSVVSLKNGTIKREIENIPGKMSLIINPDGPNTFYLSVDAYDAVYSPSFDFTTGHTYKTAYLFYDGNEYKEYGATEISEDAFLKYTNAQAIREQIAAARTDENTEKIEFSYFTRSNGKLHIQCDVYKTDGLIFYYSYTFTPSDSALPAELTISGSEGRTETHYTELPVLY